MSALEAALASGNVEARDGIGGSSGETGSGHCTPLGASSSDDDGSLEPFQGGSVGRANSAIFSRGGAETSDHGERDGGALPNNAPCSHEGDNNGALGRFDG